MLGPIWLQSALRTSWFWLFIFIMLTSESEWLITLDDIINSDWSFLQVIRCVGGEASRSYIDYFTDIILALNKKYFDNLCRYMNTMVTMDRFPTEICTREQKEHFARMVLKERANKRKLQETVREFSLLCRGKLSWFTWFFIFSEDSSPKLYQICDFRHDRIRVRRTAGPARVVKIEPRWLWSEYKVSFLQALMRVQR